MSSPHDDQETSATGRMHRGQSETIGVVILTGVVVLVVGVGVTPILLDVDTTPDPLISISVSATDDRVHVCHDGGDSVAAADVRVAVGDRRLTLAEFRDVGAPDSTFDPGDCRVIGHSQSGSVRVTVATAETVLENTEASVPAEVPALEYQYFEASGSYTTLADHRDDSPVETGTTDTFDISLRERGSDYAFNFTGELFVPTEGTYTFYTWSDDGSRLYVDGEVVVDNGGLHANRSASGSVDLSSGTHEITVTHFEHTGAENLLVKWEGPGFERERLTDTYLSTGSGVAPDFTADCDGLTCTFDASATTADGEVTSYEWDFGDGEETTTVGPTVTHTFGSGGTYTLDLRVDTTGGSGSTVRNVAVETARPADDPGPGSEGLTYRYYEADDEFTSLPDFGTLSPDRTGTTETVELKSHRPSNYAFNYTGYVEVPSKDTYTFYTTSDDGSRLYIGDTLVVQNDGLHAARERSGEIELAAGKHRIRIEVFEHTGQEIIEASIDSDDMTKHELKNLTHQST